MNDNRNGVCVCVFDMMPISFSRFVFYYNCSTTLSRICIKLVVVMGCTWICDVASWAHSLWYDDLYYVWIITDLINTLQGVFIFIVIGCQHQVWILIRHTESHTSIGWRSLFFCFALLCCDLCQLKVTISTHTHKPKFNWLNLNFKIYIYRYSGFQCIKTNVAIEKYSISTQHRRRST